VLQASQFALHGSAAKVGCATASSRGGRAVNLERDRDGAPSPRTLGRVPTGRVRRADGRSGGDAVLGAWRPVQWRPRVSLLAKKPRDRSEVLEVLPLARPRAHRNHPIATSAASTPGFAVAARRRRRAACSCGFAPNCRHHLSAEALTSLSDRRAGVERRRDRDDERKQCQRDERAAQTDDGAACCRPDRSRVDLDARERDFRDGPLADEGERPGRPKRRDPLVEPPAIDFRPPACCSLTVPLASSSHLAVGCSAVPLGI
jgi:hypothetical protein